MERTQQNSKDWQDKKVIILKLHVFVKSWKNASLVKLIHIFERVVFFTILFYLATLKKTKNHTHTQKKKERRKVTAKTL